MFSEQIYVLDNLHYWLKMYENVHWTSASSESSSSDSSKESNDSMNNEYTQRMQKFLFELSEEMIQ